MTDTFDNPQDLAVWMHTIYESAAPMFGYETRNGTRQFDPDSPNGKTMPTVAGAIITRMADEPCMSRDDFKALLACVHGYFEYLGVAASHARLTPWLDLEANRHGFGSWQAAYDELVAGAK